MLFNGKYYNKPGHLGMTRAELKEALAGGGGEDKIIMRLSYDAEESAYLSTEKFTSNELKAAFEKGDFYILADDVGTYAVAGYPFMATPNGSKFQFSFTGDGGIYSLSSSGNDPDAKVTWLLEE